ncbi:MAG: acyltransferase [Microgenomates group bacterium]|jgi:peptidoglycan/LPS O-acetylase OafA/YrhL
MQILISAAESQTQIFLIILALLLLFSVRRRENPVFDLRVTNEIKGLAILMVIFAHVGYILVSDNRFLFPISVGGGIGVNLFLFLSGYGMSVSAIRKQLSIFDFYKKKITNLSIPVCLILTIFLLMDITLLNRGYSFTEIWHSFIGYYPIANPIYNINSPLWFITPILFYYLIYPLIFNKKYLFLSGTLLMGVSYFFLFNEGVINFLTSHDIFKRDVLTLYRTHYIAFPLGLIVADLATNKTAPKMIWNFLSKIISKNKIVSGLLSYLALFGSAYIAWYTAIYSGVGKGDIVEQNISLISCAAILYLFIFNKIRFGILGIFGLYSFEIYLIHWPILSRFDIFYKILPPAFATTCYLVFFLLLGFMLDKLTNFISNRVFKV